MRNLGGSVRPTATAQKLLGNFLAHATDQLKPSKPEVGRVKKIHTFSSDTNTETLISGCQWVTHEIPSQRARLMSFDTSSGRNIQRMTWAFGRIRICHNHC